MSKFVIECPRCGKYNEASSGFFAKKKISCTCGHVIDVRTESMSSRICPHCGNNVIFDQRKGDSAKCPVCHEKINTLGNLASLVKFHCPSCSCELSADKNADTYTCPLCDTEIDVQKAVAKEAEKNKGLASVIKYEGDNQTFVWKHPIEDFNLGSQLIVHESQEAVFFRDGQALDLFDPGRYTLETQNLPVLEKLYKLPTNADTPFHSEVYFINKTVQMAVKWGTPDKVRFIDPLTGTPLELGASGEMNLTVSDSRRLLIKLIGTMTGIAWGDESDGFTKSLQKSFRPLISNAVKTNLPTVIKENNIDLLEIDEKLDTVSESLRTKITAGFEEYGLTIPQFYVTSVVLPEDDPNFKRIRELHTVSLQAKVLQAQATVKIVEAQNETLYRTEQEKSKAAIEAARRDAELQRQLTETEIRKREAERKLIDAQAEAQAMRMQGLTEAEIMRAKGYNQKDVLQADVQKAYAEGIGNMTITGGGGGAAGDIVGLGVGLAAAGVIAPQIGNMFGQMQNTNQPADTQTPAPAQSGWDCSCGQKNITSNFCPNCGSKKPEPKPADSWDCSCGTTGITSKFCPNCGSQRPVVPKGWKCPNCGKNDITTKFCPKCGTPRPAVPETWDCPNCGHKDITTGFCPDCGHKKGE